MGELIQGSIHSCQIIKLWKFLGKKWTVALLHNLSKNPVNYNHLLSVFGKKINPTLLSNRLHEFIEFKIVEKVQINGSWYYRITPMGSELKAQLHVIKNLAIKSDYSIPALCTKNACLCHEAFVQITNTQITNKKIINKQIINKN